MGRKKICRPIIFYNNFLPPIKDVQDWQYCAWGIWDGIDVEKNIASSEETVLEGIWKYQKEFCRQLKGKYTAQIIYAIKYDEIEYDESFWSEKQDQNYPFTFFIRMQFEGDVEKLWMDRQSIQKSMECVGRVSVNVYLTYDNFDLLIVLKTDSYESGANMINRFYQGNCLEREDGKSYMVKSSFSVFAMKQKIINNIEKNNIAGLIEEVDIRMIERQGGGIAAIEEILKKYYGNILNDDNCVRKEILGVEDEIISFRQIPWNIFLNFYKDREGIFNNANQYFQRYLLGTTTIIIRKAAPYQKKIMDSRSERTNEETVYSRYIKDICKKLKSIKENGNGDWCKELDVIVNALSKFKQPVFSDYVFLTIMRPLNCLLELCLKNAEGSKGVVINDKQMIFDFVKSFNMYTQNAIRSDRNSIQMMDVNDKIYAIPVKLNAFYNAYIFWVCELLNRYIDEEGKKAEGIRPIEYNFWAIPGIADKVWVTELYKRVCEESRLIKVEIPEQEYYDTKGMMIILAHEAAHYVGRGIREREYRYKSFLQAIAHIYICYILQQYKYGKDIGGPRIEDDKIYMRLEKRMASMLEIVLERETNPDYLYEKNDMEYKETAVIDAVLEENIKYQHYISFIQKYVTGAIVSIIDSGMENIFAPVLCHMSDKEKKDFLEIAGGIADSFLYEYSEGSTLLFLSTMMERLIMVYEECFADLMSVLLLKMTPHDYFSCLLKEGREQGIVKENVEKYDYTFRALMVTICMLRSEEDSHIFVWSADDVANAGDDKECTNFIAEIGLLYRIYVVEEKRVYETEDYDKSCVNIFKDKQIIENIVDYLRRCREKYYEVEWEYKDDRKGTEITRMIRNLYKYSKSDEDGEGLEFHMMEQQRLIEEYKKDLFSVWDKKNK